MKSIARKLSTLTVLFASGHGSAEVIYSNLQNITIPTTYDGTYIDVDGGLGTSTSTFTGWDLNAYMGGVYVANNSQFQPGRTTASDMGTLQNFAVGSTIDAGLVLGTGMGGSINHLGNTFTAGEEGIIGFKTGGNYGWMRVIFTGNTSGAVIKDWAYDNSGASINVGRIEQGAAVGNAQLVTLSPGIGEAFTLGSAISDAGSVINSVAKTGAGTTTLTSTSYTGTTTLNGGRLVLSNATGFASNSVTLASGTFEVSRTSGTQTLGGTLSGSGTFEKSGAGTVNLTADSSGFTGKTVVRDGTLALGSSGTLGSTNELALAGGTFDVSARVGGYTVANLTGNGSVTGSLSVSTRLAIGNSAGAVAFENLGLEAAATSVFELGGGAGDLASISGLLTLNGALDLDLLAGQSYVPGEIYTLFSYHSGNLSGTFSGLANGDFLTDAGGIWKIDYNATSPGLNGGELGINYVTVTAVPEPRAALIGGLGLLALLRRRRTK